MAGKESSTPIRWLIVSILCLLLCLVSVIHWNDIIDNRAKERKARLQKADTAQTNKHKAKLSAIESASSNEEEEPDQIEYNYECCSQHCKLTNFRDKGFADINDVATDKWYLTDLIKVNNIDNKFFGDSILSHKSDTYFCDLMTNVHIDRNEYLKTWYFAQYYITIESFHAKGDLKKWKKFNERYIANDGKLISKKEEGEVTDYKAYYKTKGTDWTYNKYGRTILKYDKASQHGTLIVYKITLPFIANYKNGKITGQKKADDIHWTLQSREAKAKAMTDSLNVYYSSHDRAEPANND